MEKSTKRNRTNPYLHGVKYSSVDDPKSGGITCVMFTEGRAMCYADMRGGWCGITSSLSSYEKNMIDGICIAGGSELGKEAIIGVANEMWNSNENSKVIPNIEGACIFSHNLEYNRFYPTTKMGKQAYKQLSYQLPYSGQIGAGLYASKGQGITSKNINGFDFLCLVVNNAIGNVYDTNGVCITDNDGKSPKTLDRRNTTITVVVTDMILDYFELKQLSQQLHCSMAKSIRPFNTFQDGDVFYMCSTQKLTKPKDEDLTDFYLEVEDLLQDAIIKSASVSYDCSKLE